MRRLAVPAHLQPSAVIDLAHVLLGIRPIARVQLPDQYGVSGFRTWARRHGLFVVADADCFVMASRRPGRLRRAMMFDRSTEAHARALGMALGYPACCCRAAALVGEAHIDEWAAAVSARRFVGRFRMIDPRGYRAGAALISHVPCSTCCVPSVQLAARLIRRLGG